MADNIVVIKETSEPKVITLTSGAKSLVALTDTPSDYTGKAGKTLSVKPSEDGVEFSDSGAGDMNKLTYDTNDNGKVDTSDALITHAANTNNPHSVTASQVSITDSDSEFNSSQVEDALKELAVKTDVNGFDLYDPDSMPDASFDISTRTLSITVKSGQTSFSFWVDNKKVTKTTTQTKQIPDVTGSYYFYFNDSGDLDYVVQGSVPDSAFYKYAIISFVYWNAEINTSLFNPNEMHGKDMAGATHQSKHETDGAKFSNGLNIEGLADASKVYTQSTSGKIWDEDIPHEIAANSTGHKMLYRYGTAGAWRTTSADLYVGHKETGDSYYSWNKNNSGTWEWVEGTSSTDFWITFFVATPMGIMKLAGQNAYSRRGDARDAILTEVNNITTDGLPSPEFVFLGCVIVKRSGDLENMSDGSVYYNLVGSRGSGNKSDSTAYASDVPTDTTNFNAALSTEEVNVQLALDVLDNSSIVTSETTAPTSAPEKVGNIYIDTVAGSIYISKGTSSSADWIKLN